MEADRVIRALSALAQGHRLAAFRLLVQAGEQGVAARVLAEKLEVPPSSMSFHLAQLANAGRRSSPSLLRLDHFVGDCTRHFGSRGRALPGRPWPRARPGQALCTLVVPAHVRVCPRPRSGIRERGRPGSSPQLHGFAGRIGKRRQKLIAAGSSEPSDPHPIPIRLSSRAVLNQVS